MSCALVLLMTIDVMVVVGGGGALPSFCIKEVGVTRKVTVSVIIVVVV
jgi:hypothetical protein